MSKKTILVAGTSRSGTSIASAITCKLGADWMYIDHSTPENPNGCFESLEFNSINNAIAKDMSKFNDINKVKQLQHDNIVKFAYKVTTMSDNTVCGFKASPNALPFFIDAVPNPHIIYTVRNLLHCALSGIPHFKNNYGRTLTLEDAIMLYGSAQNIVNSCIDKYKHIPHIILAYEDMSLDPVAGAQQICDMVDGSLSLNEENTRDISNWIIGGYSSWRGKSDE